MSEFSSTVAFQDWDNQKKSQNIRKQILYVSFYLIPVGYKKF